MLAGPHKRCDVCVCVCVFVINGGILAEKNSRTERKEIRNPFDIGFFFFGKNVCASECVQDGRGVNSY